MWTQCDQGVRMGSAIRIRGQQGERVLIEVAQVFQHPDRDITIPGERKADRFHVFSGGFQSGLFTMSGMGVLKKT